MLERLLQAKYIYLLVIFAILWAGFARSLHDYIAYELQWEAIRNGINSYSIEYGNAYGITFNYFAYLDVFGFFKLPRVIFVGVFLYSTFLLIRYAQKKNGSISYILKAAMFLNPLLWVMGVLYGSNDMFMAGMTMISILLYTDKKFISSAWTMAIAVCFKFTPLFVVPYFVLSRKGLNIPYTLTLFISLSLIIFIGYMHWGEHLLYPLQFGSERPSSLFSIFRFIRSNLSPFQINLDHFSMPLILLSSICCFLSYLVWNVDRYLIALLSLSFVVLFYKVGHHQFYILLWAFSLFNVVRNIDTFKADQGLQIASLLFWGILFFYTIIFFPIVRDKLDFLFKYSSIILFTFHVCYNLSIVRILR